MQRYYRAARVVKQLNTIVLQNLTALIAPQMDREFHPINERFGMRGELLEAASGDLFQREPGALLETFTLLQQHHELKGIGAATLRSLWRSRSLLDERFRAKQEHRVLFMQILTSPSRVHRELQRMNQYGVLGRYIPAFGRIVGQMQHDLYHVYTVDEHILKVIRNLRRFAVPELAHEFPLGSRLMSDFARPEGALSRLGFFTTLQKAAAAIIPSLARSTRSASLALTGSMMRTRASFRGSSRTIWSCPRPHRNRTSATPTSCALSPNACKTNGVWRRCIC
jgi:[protein-PII] uridylyltransferase